MSLVENAANLALVYVVYTAASVGLTLWLARTLFRSGAIFLEDIFADNPRLAEAVNRLLVVGFYLLNLGYALVTLRVGAEALSGVAALEALSMKLGKLMLVLGALHFFNLYLFHRMQRRGQLRLAPPPVRPQLHHETTNGAGHVHV